MKVFSKTCSTRWGKWCLFGVTILRRPAIRTVIGTDNVIDIDPTSRKSVTYCVRGHHNRIQVGPHVTGHIRLLVFGDENTVSLAGETCAASEIQFGAPDGGRDCRRAKLTLESGITASGVDFMLMEAGSSISIGQGCLFSTGIKVWCTDSHAILDKDTGKVLNLGRSIVLEDRVWVGQNAAIQKNTYVAHDSVVGRNAVVTKEFHEPNVVLAGIPAKIVRTGITWSRATPDSFDAGGGPVTSIAR